MSSDNCNGGWGNYIHIEHSSGVYSHYAHLSAILVNWGQHVKRGQPIGVEGSSGLAGSKHLHFSLHVGDPVAEGVGVSVPIERLVTAAGTFAAAQLSCGNWEISQNVRPETRITSSTVVLEGPKQFSFRPNHIWDNLVLLDSTSRKRVELTLSKMRDPVARYWFGMALQLDGDLIRSREILEGLVNVKQPQWLSTWANFRLAEIDMAQHRIGDAKRRVNKIEETDGAVPRDRLDLLRQRIEYSE